MTGLMRRTPFICMAWLLCLTLLGPAALSAAEGDNWWDVTPEEENPSPYYNSILYSDIAPLLHRLEGESDRISVKVIGQSAGGRDLFLVTIAAAGENQGRLGYYKMIRRLMRTNPERALALVDSKDVKVPVLINGSIHGDEYPGTDACIRLIRRLAHYDNEEIRAILDNMVLLINVVQNPDGRVLGIRRNAAGFDINRDFFILSQPESRVTVNVMREWNPLVLYDLHGFVEPMLIEPCAPPHLSNAEYDLFIKWALPHAQAMGAELEAQTGYGHIIPYTDWPQFYAWDDWSPSYAAVYSILPGTYGHTLETPYRDERGVDAQYAAMWGGLKYVIENKNDMLRDQIEIFKRGFNAEPQQPISDEMLAQTEFNQYNELTITEFPAAYIIPAEAPLQKNPHAAADLVDYLLMHGVEVKKAKESFTHDNVEYPAGAYIVRMDQAKRAMANTALEDGPDLSGVEGGLEFYSPPVSWSVPLLWGVSRVVVQESLDVPMGGVYEAARPAGDLSSGDGAAFVAWAPESIEATRAANTLLARGLDVYRLTAAAGEGEGAAPTGSFIAQAGEDLTNELTGDFGLDLSGLTELPGSALLLAPPRIAINKDVVIGHVLDEMGFEYELIPDGDIIGGVDMSEYDLFINSGIYWNVDAWWATSLDDAGRAAMNAFFQAGGDYVGWSDAGVSFAVDAQLMDVEYSQGNGGGGIISMVYDGDLPAGAGFGADEHGFIADPIWFTQLGDGVVTAARIAPGEFFTSGYWPAWQDAGAADQPIIVHGENEARDAVLFGVDPVFRGLPRDSFRALANAVFSCQE
ncbi:MAG: hypothetical protein GY859_29100 [Desulfobacterales bacterium]|nr:hypothetical protein [Desulfobacterales bacterium]